MTGNGNASYTYDASGAKLSSTQAGTTREYIAGIQYTNGAIDFIQTEEGIATRDQSTGAYKYNYNLKDHLVDVSDICYTLFRGKTDHLFAGKEMQQMH